MRSMRRFIGVGFAASLGAATCAFSSSRRASLSAAPNTTTGTSSDGGALEFDFELLVIGGGSGGLAAAKRAAEHGAKVGLCDFVVPSPAGTAWGLGGTCVNVGCIPKKLMHQAALVGETLHTAGDFGWTHPGGAAAPPQLDWSVLQSNVDMHIRSLNFGYTASLRSKKVSYMNALARVVGPHQVECVNKKGERSVVTSRHILLAGGGRPVVLDIPGKELAITSDDLFRRKADPGATLVVGSGYIGLECAGFLHAIGRPATVMLRSEPLRGMDADMARRAADVMKATGVQFVEKAVPTSIEKRNDGRLSVTYKNPTTNATDTVGPFDTVLFATGRRPETARLTGDAVKLALSPATGKVIVDASEATNIPSISAIGDIAEGRPELTPVAIRAGILFADRLMGRSTERMLYELVPTTVFTPVEYGFVGLSEERATAELGEANLDVFHTSFAPLEWALPHRDPSCYMKLLVDRRNDKVVGFHLLAPNAGEVTQGVAVAMRAGATKSNFDAAIGIHPTIAENMTTLRVTKRSGEAHEQTGC